MPVCEVVLERDVRAPELLSLRALQKRYHFRRLLSALCLLAIDLGAVTAALFLTRNVRTVGLEDLPMPGSALLLVLFIGILAAFGLYGMHERRRNWRHVAGAAGLVLLASLVAQQLTAAWPLTTVLLTWAIAVGLSITLRLLYDLCLRLVLGCDPTARRIIFLGSPEAMESFSAAWREHTTATRRTHEVGLVTDRQATPEQGDRSMRCLGSLDDLETIVERERPDELVIIDYDVERTRMTEIVELCRDRRLTLKLTSLELRFGEASTTIVDGCAQPVFVAHPDTARGLGWLVKRWLDVTVAAVLLALLAPLFAAVAVAVKLTSPGPVFFTDRRIGLGERVFDCYKFRTMRSDAPALQAQLEAQNEADGAIFKLRDDPRVTSVGRVLRKLSIDELPQLINVLRGDMSLVGPRPLPMRDNGLMEATAKRRHVVLPGITGMWQVSGRSDTSFDDMIDLDFAYIDSWSIWLDLRIIARTFKAVFASEGAY